MEKKQVRCTRCGYTWYTRSKLQHVTCPNCQYKIKIGESL